MFFLRSGMKHGIFVQTYRRNEIRRDCHEIRSQFQKASRRPGAAPAKAELRAAQGELSFAYRQFDQALAPELIDCCIYEINAAKARCDYLIRAIKERCPGAAAAAVMEESRAWT